MGDNAHELFIAALVGGNVVLPLTEQMVAADEGGDLGNMGAYKLEVAIEDAAVDAVSVGCGRLTVCSTYHRLVALEGSFMHRY